MNGAAAGQEAPRRSSRRLLMLTAVVTLVGALVWIFVRPIAPVHGLTFGYSPWVVLPALALAFLVTESSQIYFEIRRHTWSMSLSDIPLVVGLLLFPPWWVLVARLAAYTGLAIQRRMSPAKAVFNLVLFATEVGVAARLFQFLGADYVHASGWAASYVGVLIAVLISGVTVAVAMMLIGSPMSGGAFLYMVLRTLAVTSLSATIGLSVVLLIGAQRASIPGLVFLTVVLVMAYRRHSRLQIEHRDLGELYELTRDMAGALQRSTPDVEAVILDRVRRVFRAERAQLWTAADSTAHSVSADGRHERTPVSADYARRQVLGGSPVLAGPKRRDPALQDVMRSREVRQFVAVPLRVGDEVVGGLEVHDRLGQRATFGPSDLSLLSTFAVHAGLALNNARLLGRLRHEAEHDPLTGLPNRRAFTDRLEADLAKLPAGGVLAVLALDLQQFKEVNDAFGRGAADQLLVEVATRLRDKAPDPERVARFSSDELGVYAVVSGGDEARALGEQMQAVLRDPFDLGGVQVEMGAVAGIALYPDHGRDAVALCQHADVAMYAAKQSSRGILVYDPTMDASSVRRFGLVADLRRAVEAGDLVVWYQPKVSLDGAELVGVEALVRWQHPDQGMITPDEFIPLAERTGLVGPITTFVLNRALADLSSWLANGHRFGVAVNLSPRSLTDESFVTDVLSTVSASGVPPRLLTLEITETAVMAQPARAVPILEQLRSAGIRLSVDDFGIGQSSLTYLRRLPVSEVKVDRSFVMAIASEPGDQAIVRAVVDLSRPLNLTVVAEGVESEEARGVLAALGCHVMQGYLLTRPLPRDELERWIERRTVAPDPGAASGRRRLRAVS